MKRVITLLLALAMLLGAALPALAEHETLVKTSDFTVQPLRYKVFKTENTSADITLYMRVVNNTDRKISVWLKDMTVDGVPVIAGGIFGIDPHTDTGADSDEHLLIIAGSANKDAASEAILHGRKLKGNLVVTDYDNRDELYSREVTIDLGKLDSERTVYTAKPTATPRPTPTPAPDYRVLSKGCKGEDVRRLQVKLIELGYLNDKADGVYGSNTAAAVKALNEANGLDGGATATWETQDMVFSGLANPYREPWMPLEIGPNFKWELIVDSTFFFRVQVTNQSRSRTIKGFELSLYQTDLWGKQIGGKNLVYFMDTRTIVNPGKIVYSNNFNLGSFYSTDTVWVGVSKIVFMDGEIREVPRDEIVYYSCLIR